MNLCSCEGICVVYVRSFFLVVRVCRAWVLHSRAYVCLFALGVVVCCL